MLLYPSSLSGNAEFSEKSSHKKKEIRRKLVQQQVADRMLRSGLSELSESSAERTVIFEQALKQLRETVSKQPEKKREKEPLFQTSGARNITRREYPALVELKIAGRSAKEIARILEVPEGEVRRHISLALSEYRNGKLIIRSGQATTEARKKGAEKSREFYENAGIGDSAFPAQSAVSEVSGAGTTTIPSLSITA